MLKNQKLIEQVVLNNAEWCEIICNSFDMPGETTNGLWINANQVPMHYPNIITLNNQSDNENLQKITELTASSIGEFSVKDSFNNLDLTSLGFSQLFKAYWIAHTDISAIGSEYLVINTPLELANWQKAWSDNSINIFKPTLLTNASVRFIAIYDQDKIISGAILNKSSDVVGISNVFCLNSEPKLCWLTYVQAARNEFGNIPVVGYEKDNELKNAEEAGFKKIGPLGVWVKK